MPVPYSRAAELYDRIYADKPFAAETTTIRELVAKLHPAARSLLDVGCGTGGHLQHLREHFDVEGLDVSADMLAVAARKLPGVSLHEGDLRSFALTRRFDVVTSFFSAIGYVRSATELDDAIATMARHLAPGGLLLVEPWFTPEQWHPDRVHANMCIDSPDLKVARFCMPSTRDRFAVTPMHHLVGTLAGVEHFVETHELFLAETAELEHAFAAAGLTSVHYEPDVLVRGLWIGRAQ